MPARKLATKKKTAPKKKVANRIAEKPASPAPKLSTFVKKQQRKLIDLRSNLMRSINGVQEDAVVATEGSDSSGGGMHQGDAGSDAYDRDFALNLLSKEQDALQEIEAALERMDDGTYGICEISKKRILQARLEAIPFARLTVECQAKWEKEHGDLKFRSTSIGGISGAFNEGETVFLDGER